MIIYASFTVDLYNLKIKTEEELEALRRRIDFAVRNHVVIPFDIPSPRGSFETDIEVECNYTAGVFES